MKYEVWNKIPGFKNHLASNIGRVKSLSREIIGINGVAQKIKEKILKPSVNKNGYYILNLGNSHVNNTQYVHRLIASAFIDNLENKPCINHKDGNKLNNNLENLEWCTVGENNLHAYKYNLKKHYTRKVIDTKTGTIYNSIKETSNILNINESTLKPKLYNKVRNNTFLKLI